VALDGSPLAETALLPATHLATALAQYKQGVVHLLHVVKPHASASETEEVEQAQAYLQRVREHLLAQSSGFNLLATWSVTLAQDVAETIVTTAQKGTEGGRSRSLFSERLYQWHHVSPGQPYQFELAFCRCSPARPVVLQPAKERHKCNLHRR
jgi:hypothetical protein